MYFLLEGNKFFTIISNTFTNSHLSLFLQLVYGFWERNQDGGRTVRESLLDKADEVLGDMAIDGFSDKADEGRETFRVVLIGATCKLPFFIL